MTTELRARDYGVTPSAADCAPGLRAMAQGAQAVPGPVRLVFEPGVHTIRDVVRTHVSVPDLVTGVPGYYSGPLTIRRMRGLTIEGEGARFVRPGGFTTSYDEPDGHAFAYPAPIIRLIDCRNVVVRGLELDGGGDSLSRGIDHSTGRPHTHLGAHGIALQGCRGVRIEQVEVDACTGDGIQIGGFNDTGEHRLSYDVRLADIIVRRASRNGLAITGARRVTVERSSFFDTGASAYGGHSPVAGIDVEPDRYPGDGGQVPVAEKSGAVTFREVRVESSRAIRAAVAHYERIDGVTWERCRLVSHAGAGEFDVDLAAPGTTVRDCTVVARRPLFANVGRGPHEHTNRFERTQVVILPGHRWLDVGRAQDTGPVELIGCEVSSSGARALQLAAPNAVVRECGFHTTAEAESRCIAQLAGRAAGSVVERNRWTTGRASGEVLVLRGGPVPQSSVLGPNVTVHEQ